jgi:DNA-binding beta-propeller fold protein YncE
MGERALGIGVAVAALAATAASQSGPGLPNLVYGESEVFTTISITETNVHGQSAMFDGYMASFRTGVGIDFYDISNPYDPVLVSSVSQPVLVEAHTFAETTAYGGKHMIVLRGSGGLGGTGFAIWDLSDIANPSQVVSYDVPGVPGGYATGLFWLFYQPPYVYCGAGSLGLYVVDVRNPASPFVASQLPTSQTGGFNAVNTFAVGNQLIVTNSDGGPGMARFDLSDPINPQLVQASTLTSIPYGLNFNGGLLWVAAVSGPVAEPTGQDGSFEVHNPYLPGFPVVGQANLPSRGGTAMYQDGFVHIAASTQYGKLDVRDLSNIRLIGTTNQPTGGGDWDWVAPLGNLAALGDDQAAGTSLIPHQALPDNTGPSVTMVVPENGATDRSVKSRVGVTMSDMIELTSVDASSFIVRPVGGEALPGVYAHQFGIVNFTPQGQLQADTTYEVVLPTGGMKDWAGNGVPATFTSRFSTGNNVTAIVATATPGGPANPGEPVGFDVSASGPGPFQYSWDFGDGTPPTAFSGASQATHTYTDAGHFAPVVTVTNGTINGTATYIQTVHHALTAGRPTRSSTIVLDEPRNRAWTVNADNDSVTAIDTLALTVAGETSVGAHPRTLARAPDGTIWVVCGDDATIHVLEPVVGTNVATIPLPPASKPYGIAMSPDGSAAYVTLRATGQVAALDPTARALLETIEVGPEPKGIAIAADSERIFVSRFISAPRGTEAATTKATGGYQVNPFGTQRRASREPSGQVYELSAATGSLARILSLAMDPGPDTDASGRGLPNYLSALTLSPDGRRLWVPSKKDNIERGMFRDGLPLTFDNTVRTIVSQIDLFKNKERLGARIDFNNRELASAVEFSPLGDYAFHALQGSNAVDVRDAYSGAIVAGIEGTGLAPQGLVLSSDGARLYVHNFMSRSVTVYDASGVTSSVNFALPLIANLPTVDNETLSPGILRGKQIFYNAADPRMSQDGYLSCASCHLEGGEDGQVWDFTGRGEGLRNTISLQGRAGTAHGNVHWTANFDEIQDFENDIRGAFGGDGFMRDDDFFSGTVSEPLGQPKAGYSSDLDALASYVASLGAFGVSPHRQPGGTLTPGAQVGKILFVAMGCTGCHNGATFQDGQKHDVGTMQPGSGLASGGTLTGFDTPTMRGLWNSAPYFHDGSAKTLMEVLTRDTLGQHGNTLALTPKERRNLVAYLKQVDDLEPAP